MKLWTAHIEALRGFYASDAYVVAENQEQALERLMAGVLAYIQAQVKDYYTCFLIDADPDEPEWDDQLALLMGQIEFEASSKLKEVVENVIINVRV